MKTILNQATLITITIWFTTVISSATSFTTIYNFPYNISAPHGGVVLASNVLYGTTAMGGSGGGGTIFRVKTDGTSFTVMHSFSALVSSTNSDGAEPRASLVLSGNTLYGVASRGGIYGGGTLFKVNVDGTGFTNLRNFNTDIGASGLVLSGNTLYGTAVAGGTFWGALFKINIDGTGFTNLHSFMGTDGASPLAALVLSDNTLYGTTQTSGSGSDGTIFRINTDGTGFTNLYNFNGTNGAYPQGSLVLSGNTLFGTTSQASGVAGSIPPAAVGTIFRINIDGTGFTNLHNFIATNSNPSLLSYTNADGARPDAGLTLYGDTLYGTTYLGGSNGVGTIFKINTDGTEFAAIFHFNGISGGAPMDRLTISGGTAYGTTTFGGTGAGTGGGTVFALRLVDPISLSGQWVSGAIVLNWSESKFSLQASPALTGVYSDVSGASSPYTNTTINPQMFFRLQAK